MCVLHMCEYPWFQKHSLFYFLSIIHCGKTQCAVHIVGSLPSICSPLLFPTAPDFHLGIWGPRDIDSTPSSVSCHCSAGKSQKAPFLVLSKRPKRFHWATRLYREWPCYPNLISYSPPLLFHNYDRHAPTPRPSLTLICWRTSH